MADDKDPNSPCLARLRERPVRSSEFFTISKQDQKRVAIPMDRHVFERAVAQFIDTDFDEGLINKYYRVPSRPYTTELQVPTINADSAPKAFGVEKTVAPQKWMAHYKGQVAPPEDGTYRFLGDADDFLAVAVNGKVVLVADTPGTSRRPSNGSPKIRPI